MARERAVLVRMSDTTRQRLEKQAKAAKRSMTAQVVWWIQNTELDGISPIQSIRGGPAQGKTNTE